MDINLNNAVIFTDNELGFAFIYKPLDEKQGWLLYGGFPDKHVGDYLHIEESWLDNGHPTYISNKQMLSEVEMMGRMNKVFMTWKSLKARFAERHHAHKAKYYIQWHAEWEF